ncbi:MAG: PKD domain-containing protein, partial [Bacteroidetes bacterium]|nr:PKD domain-containing protein [Bacteroidota bacterium]
MNSLFTFLNLRLLYFLSINKKIDRYLYILMFGILLFPSISKAEGSKEIYQGAFATRLYLCSNFLTLCDNFGGDRTQFAVYECTEEDRLYFNVYATDEVVYLGLKGGGSLGNNKIVYRIKNLNGDIVLTETDFPLTVLDDGFIENIDEARVGPNQIAGIGGYDAIEFTPPDVGAYYIEFQRVNNNTGLPNPGGFEIEFFDITVANTTTNTAKPGRLHCKAWQLYETNGDHCSAKFYIYSNDSIITSLDLNNMQGGIWVTFCNQNGCGNTGNFELDRKSVAGQVYAPQYKVFLNEPDVDIFPPAQILGSIIPPILGQTHCDDGTIDFTIEVDKAANVEIELDFDSPYVSRTIITPVIAGINTITWDGYDGTQPIAFPVPNGVNISISVTYINGLTNLPLYDVERNLDGFVIELVSPTGTTPLVYWDDSNFPGGTTNFAGCASTTFPWNGCHLWNNDLSGNEFGNERTINTWWYTSSITSYPPDIIQERKPVLLSFVQAPQAYCAGEYGVFISVVADPNTEVYNWNYTGTDYNIIQADPGDTFIYIDFGPLATPGNIEVYGTNSNCTDPGPTATLAVAIAAIPQPQITINPNDTVCINSTTFFDGSDLSGTNITSWGWAYGDGDFGAGQNTTHNYGGTMSGTVQLIAINDDACTDTVYHSVEVTNPTIGYSFLPDPACLGDIISFTGTGDIVTYTDWNWDFGDGDFGTGRDVQHLFTSANIFDVTLSVCSKTEMQQVTINPQSIAYAGVPDTICQGDPYDFAFAPSLPDSASCDSIKWITSGIGSFNNDKLIHPVYNTLPAELGNVPLSLIAYGVDPCGNDTS